MNHSDPSSPPLSNHQLASRLRQIARQYAAQHHSYYRVRAYYHAADVIARLPAPLDPEIRAGIDLTRHPCIGPKIARALRHMVLSDSVQQLEFPLIFGRRAHPPEAA